jgi:hypothetical protein
MLAARVLSGPFQLSANPASCTPPRWVGMHLPRRTCLNYLNGRGLIAALKRRLNRKHKKGIVMVGSSRIGEPHVRIPIYGLECAASEGQRLEQRLMKIPGVLQVYVNAATESAYLQCDPVQYEPDLMLAAIADSGLRPGSIVRY